MSDNFAKPVLRVALLVYLFLVGTVLWPIERVWYWWKFKRK